MSGIMLDSTNTSAIIDAIHRGELIRGMRVRAAALYADGQWPAPPAAFSLLHRRGIATADITVTGNPAIKVARIAADTEPGDLDPQSAAVWAAEERHAGEWPVLYVNRDNKARTITLATAQGLEPVKDFGLWVATLDGTFTDTNGADLRKEPGVVAVQALSSKELGIDADASVITPAGDKWLGLEPTWDARAADLLDQLAKLIQAHA